MRASRLSLVVVALLPVAFAACGVDSESVMAPPATGAAGVSGKGGAGLSGQGGSENPGGTGGKAGTGGKGGAAGTGGKAGAGGVDAGAGGDTNGGAAGDTTNGGAAGDTTNGGAAGDTTNGGAAGDTTNGGAAGDTTNGGAAGDTTNGGAAGDTTNGGAAGDTSGGAAGDTTNGGAAGDTTNGGAAGDTSGGAAGDTSGGAAGDTSGGAAGDTTNGGAAGDTTNGGAAGTAGAGGSAGAGGAAGDTSGGAAGAVGGAAGAGGAPPKMCGNGKVDKGEECDALLGVPGGLSCTANCTLDCNIPNVAFREPTSGLCYFIAGTGAGNVKWDDAVKLCAETGAVLAHYRPVGTESEDKRRQNIAAGFAGSNESPWVAARQGSTSDGCFGRPKQNWQWSTAAGKPGVDSVGWKSGEPNDSGGIACDYEDGDEDCACADPKDTLRMNDTDCGDTRPALCQQGPKP
jgi:hypothetical protein